MWRREEASAYCRMETRDRSTLLRAFARACLSFRAPSLCACAWVLQIAARDLNIWIISMCMCVCVCVCVCARARVLACVRARNCVRACVGLGCDQASCCPEYPYPTPTLSTPTPYHKPHTPHSQTQPHTTLCKPLPDATLFGDRSSRVWYLIIHMMCVCVCM